MKKWVVIPAAIMFFLLASSTVFARGGGGCVAKGTPILTPSGSVAIEKLQPGDPVLCIAHGKMHSSIVKTRTEVQPESYIELTAGEHKLLVTPEHPVMVAPGEYRVARLIKAGEHIYQIQNGNIKSVPVSSIQNIKLHQPAYNLLVMPGGTFISSGIVVHNKGCFLSDSEILKADGTKKLIRNVRRGDELLAFTPEGKIVHAKVKEIIHHKVEEYVLLKTDHITLRVTAEHPFYTGNGTFKTVEVLKAGDTIFAWDGQSLSKQRIVSLEIIHERARVFNLQTDQPHTFFAAGLAVHNKGGGGCFPAGTMIRTLSGQTAIEKLAGNDIIQAVDRNGKITNTRVEKIFTSRSQVLEVSTDHGELRTTTEHPIGLFDGTYLEAGLLRPGNRILFRNNGALITATVLGTMESKKKELVYNLSVNQPHTFLAEDFVVHNKGGGGFSHSGSGYHGSGSGRGSSSDGFAQFLIIMTIIGIIIIVIIKNKKSSKEENLDYLYSRTEINKKAAKTEKILNFISKQDASILPKELHTLSDVTFRKLQDCWQKRDYTPLKGLLMDALFTQHMAQLQGLARNHEINKLDNLQIKQVDIVNIRYTERPDLREFTALITASARDYYVDDRTNAFLRGDNAPAQFQEFWTFQRSGDRWLLREIEQAGESDILKDENFVEMLTDQTVKGIYQDTAKKEGAAGPWLEKSTSEKATRIDRLLNFLVQTDKIWDRQAMLERARKIFLDVYLAREQGSLTQMPDMELYPEIAESLKKTLLQWEMEGTKVEYRNICVRKAELILIRNYADPAKDEFTVRISAHAQKILRKGAIIMSQQQYVAPFEEYWTFGRQDKVWKLKEVLPPSHGEKMIAEENVDEDSNAQQMQWYYRQTRAN
jgi:predicted lipid-binding transport protein (Tim44 family)